MYVMISSVSNPSVSFIYGQTYGITRLFNNVYIISVPQNLMYLLFIMADVALTAFHSRFNPFFGRS